MTERGATKTIDLLTRLDDFNATLERIAVASESGELSPSGASSAIALLTTLNTGLLLKAAAALRAMEASNGQS